MAGELLFVPLVEIIGQVESFGLNADEGCLLGIKGDWGAGKTSMLRALKTPPVLTRCFQNSANLPQI